MVPSAETASERGAHLQTCIINLIAEIEIIRTKKSTRFESPLKKNPARKTSIKVTSA
jgi:hypothetical protein